MMHAMVLRAEKERSSPVTTTERKRQLREAIGRRPPNLSPTRRRRAETSITQRVLALPEIASARGVLVCLSYGAEPTTRDLIEALRRAGKEVFVPRADRHDRSIHVHPWPCTVRTLSFGLTQPVATAPQLPAAQIDETIDAAIIVGLAFDPSGIRLGHGSGYVDRYLTTHPTFAIGLCFESDLLPEIPPRAHDVPMSVVVTDGRTLRPREDPHDALRVWLGLDHSEIDELLRGVLAGEAFDSETYARFRERLLRHIGVEERILFPASRKAGSAVLASRLAELRTDHAALTTLLVPTPDRALAVEIASLLARHNELEETNGGIYDSCLAVLTPEEAKAVLAQGRARAPVPTTRYFDGHGTVRTAREALAKARR